MTKNSTLTARVDAELREAVDMVLRPDESVSEFLEVLVRREVDERQADAAFYERAMQSLARVRAGEPTIPAAVVHAEIRAMVEQARNDFVERKRT